MAEKYFVRNDGPVKINLPLETAGTVIVRPGDQIEYSSKAVAEGAAHDYNSAHYGFNEEKPHAVVVVEQDEVVAEKEVEKEVEKTKEEKPVESVISPNAALKNLQVKMPDISTVISILPFSPPLETKPGLSPGSFKIPSGSVEKPGILEIPTCYYGIYQLDWKSIRVPEPSTVVANSVVRDYIAAQPCISYGDNETPPALPGLCWKEGKFNQRAVAEEFVEDLMQLATLQRQWFQNLVDMADDDFARFPVKRTISRLQRHAATALSLKRDWLTEIVMKNCPGCAQPVSQVAAICPFCRTIIDEERAAKLKRAV